MKNEQQPLPPDGFSFTRNERLFDRLTHERVMQFLGENSTTIHDVSLSHNNYGEYLFVTASHSNASDRQVVTFWGLGYHEYRERWLTDEWFWYDSNRQITHMDTELDKAEAMQQIEERRQFVLLNEEEPRQSRRGQLFEMLADLTDEDGAATELDDMGDWVDDE